MDTNIQSHKQRDRQTDRQINRHTHTNTHTHTHIPNVPFDSLYCSYKDKINPMRVNNSTSNFYNSSEQRRNKCSLLCHLFMFIFCCTMQRTLWRKLVLIITNSKSSFFLPWDVKISDTAFISMYYRSIRLMLLTILPKRHYVLLFKHVETTISIPITNINLPSFIFYVSFQFHLISCDGLDTSNVLKHITSSSSADW
jgi:hypothetical protein